MTEFQKPPLGVIPRWLHEERRLMDLLQAIVRYDQAGLGENAVVDEWIDEVGELILARVARNL